MKTFVQFLNENSFTKDDSLHQFIDYINVNGKDFTNFSSNISNIRKEFETQLEKFGKERLCKEIEESDYSLHGTYDTIRNAIILAISEAEIKNGTDIPNEIANMSDTEFEDAYDNGEFDNYKEDAFDIIFEETIDRILDNCIIDNGKIYIERVIRIDKFGISSKSNLNELYKGHIGCCWTYKKDAGQSYGAESIHGDDVCLCGYVKAEDVNFVETFLRDIKNYDEYEIYVDEDTDIELTDIYNYDYGKVHKIWHGDKIFKA